MRETTAIEAGPLNSTGKRRPATQAARRKRPWPRRSRRGMGLPGMVLTLVMAAIILGATFVLFQGNNDNLRVQEAMTRAGLMESDIRRTYANQPQFDAALTNGLLSKMPSSAIQEDGSRTVNGIPGGDDRRIVTPWGGLMVAGGGDTPRPDGRGTASGNRFFIAILDLPEEACEAIAASFLNSSSVVDVRTKGSSSGAFGGGTVRGSVAAINTGCSSANDDNAVAIVFRG